MRVQELLLKNGGRGYLLVNDDGVTIYLVAKYLKYLDLSGRSINTIKTYCYSLKAFYEFLAESKIDYSAVNFGILTHFVGWLRFPYNHEKVIPLLQKEPRNKLKVLSKPEVDSLYNSTTNIRDKFLIKLLFETGLRIGEALSLFIEDFVFDHDRGIKSDLHIVHIFQMATAFVFQGKT